MEIEPELGGCSIVLIGNFVPGQFSPHWFATHDFITKEAADQATVEVIIPDLARFSVPEALTFGIEIEKFSVDTTVGPWIRILDLVVRTFVDQLPETPVRVFGINRRVHFSVGSEEVRNAMGRMLAPPTAWGAWGDTIAKSAPPHRGGVTHLTMQESFDDGEFGCRVQATLQPSQKIDGSRGIFMQVNHQYQSSSATNLGGTRMLMDKMASVFDASISRSEFIINEVMKLKNGVKTT